MQASFSIVLGGALFCLIIFLESRKLSFGNFGKQPDSFQLRWLLVCLSKSRPKRSNGFQQLQISSSWQAGRVWGWRPPGTSFHHLPAPWSPEMFLYLSVSSALNGASTLLAVGWTVVNIADKVLFRGSYMLRACKPTHSAGLSREIRTLTV